MTEKSFGVKELSVIGIGTGTPTIKSSGNLNLSASTVAVGATLSVGGGLQLVGVNTSLAGTAGTTGDIKMFHGTPFIHDGIAWREFYLKEGVPVTESADTEWDNVVLRLTFDDPNDGQSGLKDYSPLSLSGSFSNSSDVVSSPRKYGDRALRIRNGYVGWAHTSSWEFDNEWTIEGWIYIDTLPTSSSDLRTIISKSLGTNARRWRLSITTPIAGTLRFHWYNWDSTNHNSTYGTVLGDYSASLLSKTWVHISLTRNATDGSIHFFFNGTESEYTSSNQVIDNDIVDANTHYLVFGADLYSVSGIDAIYDDWRISSVVRYSSGFTPPTEALPVTGTLSGPVDPPYFGSTLEKVIAETEISSFSNVSDATPSSGQVLKWNGSLWAPASDNTSTGGTGIGLTDLSVTTNPVGTNALSYDDTTGTFTFTPTSLVGYATEGYVDNAVLGIVTTGQISGFITAGASGAGFTALTGAAAGTYGDFDKSARITVDSNGRITGITEVGITTDGAGIDVTGISTFNDNVSFASTILVDGAVNLAVNNATITGTAGSTGDIKMIGGAPFFYDGSSWREFALTSGTPVTVAEDTEWDNVIFRNTFDSSTTEVSQYAASSSSSSNSSLVTSPVKYGAKALRLENGYVAYNHISAYDFTGEWTIEGWFYLDRLPTGSGISGGCLISKSVVSNARVWRLGITTPIVGTLRFHWYNWDHPTHNSTDGTFLGDYTASNLTQTWFHIALVREPDNGSIHLYIDGVESTGTKDDNVIDNDIVTNTNALLSLGEDLNNGLNFDGLIDDLRISNVARYTSVGISTTATFTPPTQAYPTSGTLTVATDPPGDKYGEIVLGASPSWVGTSGVTVSQQSAGNYRLTFTTPYSNANDYFVLSQGIDQGYASYVGVARSTTHVDFTINRQSNDAAVDTGSLAVQITNH